MNNQASMANRPEPATAEVLRTLGRQGERALDMLNASAEQLERGGYRAGEIACFCCREALRSLLALGTDDVPAIRKAARGVVVAFKVERDASDDAALARAVAELETALEGATTRNQRLLQSVVKARTGLEPARFQADTFERASRLLRSLNIGLYEGVDLDAAAKLHAETYDLVEVLFAPITVRLDEVERLLLVESPGQEELLRLETLGADPRVIDYFFRRVDGSAYFELLSSRDALLVAPSAGGYWPSASYVQRLIEAENPDALQWLRRRLRDGGTTAEQAVSYVAVCRNAGLFAAPAVLTALENHPTSEVTFEASAYLDALPEAVATHDLVLKIAALILDASAAS